MLMANTTRPTNGHIASHKKGTLAVLDIGSSKIVCMVANSDGNGLPVIHGIGFEPTAGMVKGEVIDQAALSNAIGKAIEAAERMAGASIHAIHVGISGGAQKSCIRQHSIATASGQVMLADIRRLLRLDFNQPVGDAETEDRTVLHRLPLAYTLDGETNISNPIGKHGKQLGVSVCVVTIATSLIAAIEMGVRQNYLRMETLPIANAYASGLGCLSNDDRLGTTTLLDIGGGVTSLVHFNRGLLQYLDSVPFGGHSMTRDIAECLGLNMGTAERIKCVHGKLGLDEGDADSIIPIASPAKPTRGEYQNGHDHVAAIAAGIGVYRHSNTSNTNTDGTGSQPLHLRTLSDILTARSEEICDILFARFDKAGFGRHPRPRLSLVGGVAALPSLADIVAARFAAQFGTSCQVTIGRPHGVTGLAEMNRGPAFASTAGLLRYAFVDHALEPSLRLHAATALGRMAAWVKYYIWDSAQ